MKRKGKTEEEQEENRERKKRERTNEPNRTEQTKERIKKNHISVSRSRKVVSLLFIFYTAYNYILYYFISN